MLARRADFYRRKAAEYNQLVYWPTIPDAALICDKLAKAYERFADRFEQLEERKPRSSRPNHYWRIPEAAWQLMADVHKLLIRTNIMSSKAIIGAMFILMMTAEASAIDVQSEETGVETPLMLALGGNDYETYCASCHGIGGHGDGPVAEFLALMPTDLTKLARNNGGIFPSARIVEIIDGRQQVKIHGPRDMPVWGDWFDAEAEAPGLRPPEREIVVRERIKALVSYLETIQKK